MRADTALQFAQVQKHHLERHCGDQKRPQGRFFCVPKGFTEGINSPRREKNREVIRRGMET